MEQSVAIVEVDAHESSDDYYTGVIVRNDLPTELLSLVHEIVDTVEQNALSLLDDVLTRMDAWQLYIAETQQPITELWIENATVGFRLKS